MLKITYNNKEYKFPIINPMKWNSYVYGTIDLDNNWRELDYKNGEHTLDIGATSYFEVPKNLFKELYKSDFFFSDQIMDEIEGRDTSNNLPLINFDLTIGYTKIFNFKTYESVLIGNIKSYFPTFKALENLKLDRKIVAESQIDLGNNFNYQPSLTAINFGEIKDNAIRLICTGEFETHNKTKGKVEIDIWLPINLYFEAGVYTDSFPDKTIEERLIEIKDCFASVYDISEYNLTEKVVDEKSKRVQIRFEYKK